ncbi:MAG TPA: threonine synthase [Actinomycetes bacterium]|nr:threonine synthase [Actinomycetes bacterium]
MPYLTHLECAACGMRLDPDQAWQLCPSCDHPLLARYDLARLGEHTTLGDLGRRPPGLWRYRELLPLRAPERAVSLGEGATALLRVPRLAERVSVPGLLVKDEGTLPTGTFKARGAAVGVSRAVELGVRTLALPTAGNAGAAWAAYGARAGLDVVVVMPESTPAVIRRETAACGADVYLVPGSIADAGAVVGEGCRRHGWYDASTLKEPYRIEGKKTMGFELVDQLGWRLPEVIVYPTGGGVGLIGMWKGFQELRALGWLPADAPLPRFVAAQAAGCAPVVRAFTEHAERTVAWEEPATFAAGLRVPRPLGDFLILRALRESSGTALAVPDETIAATMELAGATEGMVVCPEGAAALAAAERLRRDGWIGDDQTVAVFNTGTGLLYGDSLPGRAPRTLRAGESIPAGATSRPPAGEGLPTASRPGLA